MKTCICILLSASLMLTMVGCTEETNNTDMSFVDIYREEATKLAESGDLEAAIAALEEGVTQTGDESLKQYLEELKAQQAATAPTEDANADAPADTAEPFDISKYVGEWCDAGFSWMTGGFHLEIAVTDPKINISCSKVFSTRLADTSILANTAMINNNELTSGFSDSWGNKGILTLRFEDQQIVCTVSDLERASGAMVAIDEGEYVLQPYDEEESAYNGIIGSYVNNDGDYYLHIGYKDSTKEELYVAIDMLGYQFEMPVTFSDDGTMHGVYMGYGSEPKCAVDFTLMYDNVINAHVYIAATDFYEEITMTSTSEMPVPAESENPFYIG